MPSPDHRTALATSPSSSWLRRMALVAAFVLVTVTAVFLVQKYVPPNYASPDFIAFWTPAVLIANGENPYDPPRQLEIQRELGWTKEGRGLGIFSFLPNYYPPWMALAVVPLLAFDYNTAKAWWLVLSIEMLLFSAWFLKDTVRGNPPWLPFLLVLTFGFSIKVVAIGQVSPILLFLASLTWWLLHHKRDFAAGAALALLSIKPHLAILLTGMLLVWSLRNERFGVLRGFAAGVTVLLVSSTLAYPGWIPEMLAATRVTPMPTAYFPDLGTTWNVVLLALGLQGFPHYLAYCAVAMPLLLGLAKMVFQQSRSLEEQFGVGLLAPFFLLPYARCYDFPLLLIPALILMGTRLSEFSRALLTFTLTVLVALHILVVTANYVTPEIGVRRLEITYFWVPVLLSALWWLFLARFPSDAGGTAAGDQPLP